MVRSIRVLVAFAIVMTAGQSWAHAAQRQESPQISGEEGAQSKTRAPVVAQSQNTSKKLNPFTGNAEAIAEGRAIYMQSGCNGCHGMGGGGMGPAILDDNWKFGGDDETLFKLIKGQLPQQTMPAVFGAVLTDEQVWKIIAWVRSIYKGDPALIVW